MVDMAIVKTYTVEKLYEFESAHQLTNSCHSAECERVHGHSYKARVGIECLQLNDEEMVVNFNQLNDVVKPIIEAMDHRMLVAEDSPLTDHYSGIPKFEAYTIPNAQKNTTAERIAEHLAWHVVTWVLQLPIAQHVGRVYCVVNETRKCMARCDMILVPKDSK
jgi:6-pyruvoyl tetrahydropterin synthase/QueD family protein